MYNTKVTVTTQDIYEYKGDMLIFPAARRLDGTIDCDPRVSTLVGTFAEYNDFTAKLNETVLFYPAEMKNAEMFASSRILIVGLGKMESEDDNVHREVFRSIGGTISKVCEKREIKDITIASGPSLGLDKAVVVESMTEGILLGDYRFNKYKSEDEENPVYPGLKKIVFEVSGKSTQLKKACQRGAQAAAAVCSARDMANEPGNGWTAGNFVKYAEKLAEKYPLKCSIIDKAKMKRLGMGGILAVNQGSSEPPKLIVLEYTPDKAKETVMLVGKGLTFDSGGISLKPGAGMHDMKYDMCGGAAVLAAMQAIAEDKPSVRVVALIPATDNMPGSKALKPGDIIRHFNGITSEIVNTDAEGRLILADALAYGIQTYSPDCVVDVATLTGAVIIGLGHHYTGILSNNDELVEKLLRAGKLCGEPLWRLPLGKEYTKQIESKVADIKNAGGRPGGTITAAAYLEKFVGDTPWAHLDIAGTAWDFTEKTYIPKGPSGVSVRTLIEFVRSRK
jgi:leucyl aminopeptidase